jgi:hypothetical protein
VNEKAGDCCAPGKGNKAEDIFSFLWEFQSIAKWVKRKKKVGIHTCFYMCCVHVCMHFFFFF